MKLVKKYKARTKKASLLIARKVLCNVARTRSILSKHTLINSFALSRSSQEDSSSIVLRKLLILNQDSSFTILRDLIIIISRQLA